MRKVLRPNLPNEKEGFMISHEYHRGGYTAERSETEYQVSPATFRPTAQHFAQVVEVPQDASNVHFYRDSGDLPENYRNAL
jgi:hypothetical protein